ncbi:MAG: hypothetical protein KAT62_12455 [Desulfuromonadales bacterium]|nr:hypothetical protein [Desulfuromonadales bacterium]
MAEWTRDTPWRQGRLLTDEAVAEIGLKHPEYPDETVVIVVTHGCDLAQQPDKEPHVEVIVGHQISTLDGNNTHAKSSRTLHIEFEGSKPLSAEFVISEKLSIPKQSLVSFVPNSISRLSPPSLATLQLWLASRYRRSAFPDAFERRLVESKLAAKITKAVKPHGEKITAVFFDVDEGQEVIRTEPDDVYTLDIILLHATEPDFNAAEQAAIDAKAAIENSFRKTFLDPKSGNWKGIELRYVDAISEEALTYRQSKLLKKWRLDHISLRAEPQQSILIE